ncbi:hypothetical protein AXG93_2556s1220 [Marchantia polymorpha subsp. ruderalis]|uniref:Uncharacterized protein n=1 Tax=Marchantia polymorpha subsp. ruderalis TaxID=1480154 RepID=A0A176VDB3_MARPO|nr:hypothetical protein AXG93_2556s1220 [Marchantia polymorpha subsp. ruderalis]
MVRCRVSGRVGETSRGRIYEIRKVVQFEAHHRMSVVVNRLSLGGSLVARAFSELLAELRARRRKRCSWSPLREELTWTIPIALLLAMFRGSVGLISRAQLMLHSKHIHRTGSAKIMAQLLFPVGKFNNTNLSNSYLSRYYASAFSHEERDFLAWSMHGAHRIRVCSQMPIYCFLAPSCTFGAYGDRHTENKDVSLKVSEAAVVDRGAERRIWALSLGCSQGERDLSCWLTAVIVSFNNRQLNLSAKALRELFDLSDNV